MKIYINFFEGRVEFLEEILKVLKSSNFGEGLVLNFDGEDCWFESEDDRVFLYDKKDKSFKEAESCSHCGKLFIPESPEDEFCDFCKSLFEEEM